MYNPVAIKEFQHIFPIHDWVRLLGVSLKLVQDQNKYFQYKYLNELLPIESKISEDEEIIVTDFKFIVADVYNLIVKKTPNR